MENEREQIYLAALLHDIGKFYQRIDTGDISTSKYLGDIAQKAQLFCPSRETGGQYIHKHVLWTARFIEEYCQAFQKQRNEEVDSLLYLAACHHLAESQLSALGKIIKKADHLSSGMDRDSEKAFLDDEDENTQWEAYKNKRMSSILEFVKTSPQQKASYYLPVHQMQLSKTSIFPKKEYSEAPDYEKLWRGFIGELESIQTGSFSAFGDTLLSLMFKYTACIPASTVHFQDVSLYDHSRTTGALAVCLYDYQQAGCDNESPFLLVGGDLSGIQPYIYQIVSKFAGKNLKGRSFYLRLLSDAVVRYILKELELFQAHVIYNSGGSFYLLAPNTPAAKDKLERCISTIEEKLFATHSNTLYMAIDWVELSEDELMHKKGHLQDAWKRLFEKRDRKKSCKFAKQIENQYEQFFEPWGGNTLRDRITGEEFGVDEKKIPFEGGYIRPLNNVQIKLGKALRETECIVVINGEASCLIGEVSICPVNLGFTYYFLNAREFKEKAKHLESITSQVTVITLNGKNGNCDFLHSSTKEINNSKILEFYGGNEWEEQTFEDMCHPDEEGAFSRLGVLRMDVDNLGTIFQEGINPGKATLSRYAALSRSLDIFFSGYLNTIWREKAPKQSLIIYSGGDDLFIIGSWKEVICLAKQIREDFREFTCNNSAFSLSGGVAIVQKKFPIMKGAEESALEEGLAKKHKNGKNKNSISFMDMPLNWEKEFPAVETLKNVLLKAADDEILPKSFLSKIMMHCANADLKDHKIGNFKTYWMMAYDLGRMKERMKKDEQITRLIDNCQTEVCGTTSSLNGKSIQTNYHPLELWNFACRWAELEYRTDK